MKEFPNVLVVSHNSFSNLTNMGITMSNFFKGWDSNKLAQLYFHNEVPTSDICKKYYRITDMEMIKKYKPGKEFNENDIDNSLNSPRTDTGVVSNIYEFGRAKKPYMYLARNLIWSTKRWATSNLYNWLDEIKPDVLFYAAGDYTFSMDIALEISNRLDIPMVVYFGDDFYFFDNNNTSLFNSINKRMFTDKFEKLFTRLDTFIAASDKMQEKYTKEFNVQGHTIMNATNNVAKIPMPQSENQRVTYIGNLDLGRWQNLVEIGRSLKTIGLFLDIYSVEKNTKILEQLTPENGINFHGAVLPEKVDDLIKNSTLAVHVESLGKVNRERTKYSISTKIGGYLGSGVCIFAYGPEDVASIEYLVDNDVACVAVNEDDLAKKLSYILGDPKQRYIYADNALRLAQKRHNLKINTDFFKQIINSSI